jgi:hypothetical protein
MTFLAQFQHYCERLDLGGEGRVLFVFMCNLDPGHCHTWKMDEGANAVLILEPAELKTGLTQPPSLGERAEMVEVEARVVEWITGEDPVSTDQYADFFKNKDTYYDIPYEIRDEVEGGTKLGGVPSWRQGPPDLPSALYRFAAQFDHHHVFDGPAPNAENSHVVTSLTPSLQRCSKSGAFPEESSVAEKGCRMDVSDYEIQEPEQITDVRGGHEKSSFLLKGHGFVMPQIMVGAQPIFLFVQMLSHHQASSCGSVRRSLRIVCNKALLIPPSV